MDYWAFVIALSFIFPCIVIWKLPIVKTIRISLITPLVWQLILYILIGFGLLDIYSRIPFIRGGEIIFNASLFINGLLILNRSKKGLPINE